MAARYYMEIVEYYESDQNIDQTIAYFEKGMYIQMTTLSLAIQTKSQPLPIFIVVADNEVYMEYWRKSERMFKYRDYFCL
ncbi:hypothetical protein ISN45_Aa05g014040 [Arabidopsis thaliana x Arabidopsis arenosa]|uniref:Uncharacterized protein n=1 Tax=Arabidopsis thaliana x Arabidopsis arenosa TaxID=1240361 RepID=A0A8T1ZKF8_9BRAS|nr:hypothetical protein ISN45_Aa05g014040 [Arabidopsis thaliana x Arabidopsis arenosa]